MSLTHLVYIYTVNRRAATFGEFFRGHDRERECYEEMCTVHEMIEIVKKETSSDNGGTLEFQKYETCLKYYPVDNPSDKELLRRCMKDADDCHGGWGPCNPQNTADCVDKIGEAVCQCKHGYGDDFCNTITDLCITDPCGTHGTCKSSYKSYRCECDQNWEGKDCKKEILDCRRMDDTTFSCDHGKCIADKEAMSGTCECDAGYIGDRCSQDENECTSGSHQCDPQHAECFNNVGSYTCRCKQGFMLDTSDTHAICSHECTNKNGTYACNCPSGYYLDEDKKTFIDVNECECNDYACFMASFLQGLANMPQLHDYYKSGDFISDINEDNVLGTGGQMANYMNILVKYDRQYK